MKKLWCAVAVVFVVALGCMPAWGQGDVDVLIPIDTVVYVDSELAVVNTPVDLVGQDCVVTSVAFNQESVHPGNDLVVTSGGDVLVLPDVEAAGSGVVEGSARLTLGPVIVVGVELGPDQVFSGGMDLAFDCEKVPVTTTTTTSTTTSTTTTTTTTTTSTAPPPTSPPPEECGPDTLACTGGTEPWTFVGLGLVLTGLGGLAWVLSSDRYMREEL